MSAQSKTMTVFPEPEVKPENSVNLRDNTGKKKTQFPDEPVTPSAVIDSNGPPPSAGGSPLPPPPKPPG